MQYPGFPLLRDRIITDTALTIIKAKAQNNQLGNDYDQWNGAAPDWTPFGSVAKALRCVAKSSGGIHPQTIIKSETLEELAKCKFHLGNRILP